MIRYRFLIFKIMFMLLAPVILSLPANAGQYQTVLLESKGGRPETQNFLKHLGEVVMAENWAVIFPGYSGKDDKGFTYNWTMIDLNDDGSDEIIVSANNSGEYFCIAGELCAAAIFQKRNGTWHFISEITVKLWIYSVEIGLDKVNGWYRLGGSLRCWLDGYPPEWAPEPVSWQYEIPYEPGSAGYFGVIQEDGSCKHRMDK